MSCSHLSLMRLCLIFLQRLLTFCTRLIWFLSAVSVDICNHYLAILFSGWFSKCIQNLITFRSVSFSSGNRPSSFLEATFGRCLFTPRTCLQK